MTSIFRRRLSELATADNLSMLTGIRRGIEKESLRITAEGKLAQTPHPRSLGSALSHAYITTDYSEALMEFITPVSPSIAEALNTLDEIHRFTYGEIDGELLWAASMPCILEGDDNIPVAEYGSSNVGRMKKVYRHGLGHRYGRLMQTIAGIHYNFSMPDQYWPMAQRAAGDTGELKDYITARYLGLIRNFQRYSWLLIYLFGASPAVCKSFVRNNPQHKLQPFDETGTSLHLPFATALRMGSLGYQSDAQKNLSVCYNQLDSYIKTLHGAITQSHPGYEAIGLGENHKHQLNTSLLQIENEFYSPIRPKRITRSGETPLGALQRDGIEYIEVRCVDVNPFLPLGINRQQIQFLDSFLLFCLLQDSPPCDAQEQQQMAENMSRIVNDGRNPELQLHTATGETDRHTLARQLLQEIGVICKLLDRAHGSKDYSASHAQQQAKLGDPELTPSAQILNAMRQQNIPFFRLAMDCSQQWAEAFRANPLSEDRLQHYRRASAQSLEKHKAVEASDSEDFESYLAKYYAQYQALGL